MLTSEPGLLAAGAERESGVVRMLAQGLPMARTLEAAAVVAARVQQNGRCAMLLVEDDSLALAAGHDLTADDRTALAGLSNEGGIAELATFGSRQRAEVRPLMTYASELVGALVLFGVAELNQQTSQALDEVCAIATVAIEQRNLAEELAYRAHHDPLTHLWNRLWIEEEIARTLEVSSATGHYTGLLLIGVDSFGLINEILGSKAGSELLRQVAVRLSEAVDGGCSVARGSGDEFLVLLPNLSSPERVATFASQLLAWFDKPFQIGEHELLVRASIGTTFAAAGECDADVLQTRADMALRYAKKHERGRTAAFSPCMVKTPPERLVLEQHLRFALQKREFELFYQPQVHLATGKLVGAEALLRWKHSSLGFISPALFVPIAEQIGIIDEIGDWVIGEAIRQLESWQHSGLRGIRVAANVSALQFSRGDFANAVSRRLRTTSIDPRDLELEITESAVMRDFDHGLRQFRLLRSLGICTALDDFGTGHSSLAYLQQLPIQRLKLTACS